MKKVKSIVLMVLLVAILISVAGCGGHLDSNVGTEVPTVTEGSDTNQNFDDVTTGTNPTEGTIPTNPTEGTDPTETTPEGTTPSNPTAVLSLNYRSLKMEVKDIANLVATYSGSGKLVWESSNPNVATVNQSGKITAKGVGNATIKVTDGPNFAICAVEVVETLDYEFTVSPPILTLERGRTGKFIVTYTGTGSLTWESKDTSIATVDSKGNVYAKKVGETKVTVKDGVRTITRDVVVEAQTEETTPTIPVTLTVSPTSKTIKVGESLTLTAAYNGNKALSWSSQNSSIATVSANGANATVKGIAAGTVDIWVTDGTNRAKCEVTVVNATPPVVETLTINPTRLTLYAGDTSTIKATYNGNKSLSWSSNNTSVATVNQSGTVTALKAGTATIIVKAGSLEKTCTVTVEATTPPVPDPTLVITTKNNTEIYVGDTLQIQYEYSGDKSKLTWRSTYTDTITVDKNGKITGVAAGNSIITVTDGTLTRRINIYVNARETEPEYAKVTSITPNSFNAPLSNGIVKFAGDYMSFKAYTMPVESNRVVKVSSTNSNVVSVSSSFDAYSNDNYITLNFKNSGNATITVESADGAVKLTYSIQVRSGYSCNPGSGQLTPEQFVSCVNGVMEANGAKISTSHGFREFTLSGSDLTWAKARSLGEGWIHEFWPNGVRYYGLEYMGTNSDGNHMFRIHR